MDSRWYVVCRDALILGSIWIWILGAHLYLSCLTNIITGFFALIYTIPIPRTLLLYAGTPATLPGWELSRVAFQRVSNSFHDILGRG
jgi:hypothetical protein